MARPGAAHGGGGVYAVVDHFRFGSRFGVGTVEMMRVRVCVFGVRVCVYV